MFCLPKSITKQYIHTQQKEQEAFGTNVEAYQEKLAKIVKVELPATWIGREVEMRIQHAKQNPQFDEKQEEKMKKEFKALAENNLKVFLGLAEIVKLENVELDKDEKEQAKRGVEQKAAQNPNIDRVNEQEREELNMRIDKYLRGLIMSEE